MGDFIIEEFNHYKVSLYGRKVKGQQTDYGIQFNVPSGKVYLYFCKNYMQDNHVEEKTASRIYHIYLRAEKYPAFIDLLRHEKPLFFFYNFKDDSFYITTSDEPVGEGENEPD